MKISIISKFFVYLLLSTHLSAANAAIQQAMNEQSTIDRAAKQIAKEFISNQNPTNTVIDDTYWNAAKTGNIAGIKIHLANGIEVDQLDSNHNSALLYASAQGDIASVDLLIERGADVNLQGGRGWTALMLAALKGHIAVMERLIAAGANQATTNKDGRNALLFAITSQNPACVNVLVSHNNDVNLQPKKVFPKGLSPLMQAAAKPNSEITALLINSGAQIAMTDAFGKTALHYAAENGHIDNLTVLIAKGANINATDKSGNSAIHNIAQLSNTPLLQWFIDHGADLTLRNRKGRTALDKAARYGNRENVKLLAEKSNQQARESALLNAAYSGSTQTVATLIQMGINLNARNDKQETPLMQAAQRRHLKVIKLLMEQGANPDLVNIDGQTALMFASKAVPPSEPLVVALLNNSTTLNKQDKFGNSALIYAADHKPNQLSYALLNTLVAAGADPGLINKKNQTALQLAEQQLTSRKGKRSSEDIEKILTLLSGFNTISSDR